MVTSHLLNLSVWIRPNKVFNHKFTAAENDVLENLVRSSKPNWDLLFDMCHKKKINPMSYLKSEHFLKTLTEICKEDFPYTAFSDCFHSVRSRLLPVLHLLGATIPTADCYHAISTGYGGLLACLGGYINKKPVLLTEHAASNIVNLL